MKKQIIVLLIAAFATYVSCKKEATDETVTSSLQIRLTDAPAVYDSVIVDVIGVEVHSDQTNGWVTMNMPHPGLYNLLQFTNGHDTLIASSSIPAGKVSQIRLILGTNNSVTKNGVTYPLIVPSGSESGLKIQIHKDIVYGVTNIIQLDFDAGRSIVEQGNGVFHLKPVIRATTTGIDGSISGTIAPIFAAVAYAVSGTDTFTTTVSGNGGFLIAGVPAGSYTVCIHPDTIYSDTCFTNVTVNVNQLTNLGLIQY